MLTLQIQSFEPNNVPISHAGSDRASYSPSGRPDGSSDFATLLNQASARGTRAKESEKNPRQTPPAGQQQEDRSAQPAVSGQNHAEKSKETDQKVQDNTGVQTSAAAQQAITQNTSPSGNTPNDEVTVTVSWTGSGDELNVSVCGLPEELASALVSTLGSGTGMNQALTLGSAKQADGSASDKESTESLAGGSMELTMKLPSDPSELLKDMNEILALVQGLAQALQQNASPTEALQQNAPVMEPLQQNPSITAALQKNASGMTKLQTGQASIISPKVPEPFVQLLLKQAPTNGASVRQGVAQGFKGLVTDSSTQSTANTANGLDALDGENLRSDGLAQLRLPQGTDLTESLLSKVKVTASLSGAVEGVSDTADKGAELPSQGNGNSRFAEQGTSVQATMQRQEPVGAGPETTSFGSIVADRLAAVAEQVGLRDRPLDVLLRLKMEGGESLLVGLRDQAGKIVVQVRCADQNMVSLLESQKETIVRHLEAKQISSSISVSPIEEDVTKRQGRERTKNGWDRRQQPTNPFIETSI